MKITPVQPSFSPLAAGRPTPPMPATTASLGNSPDALRIANAGDALPCARLRGPMSPHAVRRTLAAPQPTMTPVRSFLYLGDGVVAQDLATLQQNKITHIVNATWEQQNAFPEEFSYLTVAARDNTAQRLSPYLETVAAFIEEARRQNGRVLVHCREGISRSATLVLAYLMGAERCSLGEAFAALKALRPQVEPNPTFLRELRAHERNLGLVPATLAKLTPLDAPDAAGADATLCDDSVLLEALRSWTSLHATEDVTANEFVTREPPAQAETFVRVWQQVAPQDGNALVHSLVCATFDDYGSLSPRDQRARAALGQALGFAVQADCLTSTQLKASLEALLWSDPWNALDLPLAPRFAQELQWAVHTQNPAQATSAPEQVHKVASP